MGVPRLPTPRTLAIGDIHGCLPALETLLSAIRPQGDDTLVLLGDYVDRGPQSRQTLDRLILLQGQCRLVPLLGNHDDMLLNVYDGQTRLYIEWLMFGGNATLESYDTLRPQDIPAEHIAFLRGCRLYFETANHFFVHGSYIAELPLAAQPRDVLLWESLKTRLPGPHCSGKTAIVGHTSQRSGKLLDLGYLKCIDTRCYETGLLTALDIHSSQVWQANMSGEIRD
jgi:serine/threonine protein phosphatase 1